MIAHIALLDDTTHYLTNEKVTDSATDPCFRGQGDFRVSTLWWSGILHILPFISHVASSSFFFAVSEHAPSESNIGSFLLWVCRVWVRILLLFTAERGGPSKNRTVERDGCPSVFRVPLLSSLALDCGYPFQCSVLIRHLVLVVGPSCFGCFFGTPDEAEGFAHWRSCKYRTTMIKVWNSYQKFAVFFQNLRVRTTGLWGTKVRWITLLNQKRQFFVSWSPVLHFYVEKFYDTHSGVYWRNLMCLTWWNWWTHCISRHCWPWPHVLYLQMLFVHMHVQTDIYIL